MNPSARGWSDPRRESCYLVLQVVARMRSRWTPETSGYSFLNKIDLANIRAGAE